MQRLSKVKPIDCHRGAAILTALLLMALVATLSTAALWQQARAYDIEASERARVQATWILQGASDWARLILREDGRSGGVDHLGEPWAIALQEAPLSSFLSQEATSSGADSRDGMAADALQGAFLSGEMSDMQGRLNVTNLLMDRQIHEPSLRAFRRLFDHLQLPQAELELLALNLRASQLRTEGSDVKPISTPATSVKIGGASTPLVPQTFDQLEWLGLSPRTLAQLRLYVTVLPERSTLNINTAPLPALLAATPGLDSNQAQALITARARSPFHSLAEAARSIDVLESTLNENHLGVTSRFFEVRARLRWGKLATQERTLLQRDGMVVKPLWKRREAVQGASLQ